MSMYSCSVVGSKNKFMSNFIKHLLCVGKEGLCALRRGGGGGGI